MDLIMVLPININRNKSPRSGQTIITQGDVGREFFIIQSGEAEVLVTDGGSQILGEISGRKTQTIHIFFEHFGIGMAWCLV